MKPNEIVELFVDDKPRTYIAKDIPMIIGDKTIDKEGNVYIASNEEAVAALTKEKQLVLIPYIKH